MSLWVSGRASLVALSEAPTPSTTAGDQSRMQELLRQESKVHPAIVTTPLDTIVLELSVTDSSQNIQISLYRIYYSYLRFESSSQQYSIYSITAADYGTEFLTGLSKFDNDDVFGQVGVSVARIIFARFKSDQAFRHWETNRPEGLILCPPHPTN